MPRTQPAQQQAGSSVTSVTSGSSGSSSGASRNSEKPLQASRLTDLCKYIAAMPAPCTGKACSCCKIPEVAYLLEKQHESSTLVEMLDAELHKTLPPLAGVLLKGGHSARAFRRITEAFDM